MTSRRAMITDQGRMSRALQFTPGHVHGRVDSAQPVRRRRTIGGVAQQPAELDALYLNKTFLDEIFGNGAVYSLPTPMPHPFSISTTGMGDITGLPIIVIAGHQWWYNLTAPAGWTELCSYENSSWKHGATVWSIDSYDGEPLTGFQAQNAYTTGLGGGNFRIATIIMVGGTPGRFTAAIGTPNSANMILSDPGGTYRAQLVSSDVRYDRSWTPSLPSTHSRYSSNIWYGIHMNGTPPINGSVGAYVGWYDKAGADQVMKDQTLGIGTYVPSVAASNIPINVWWTG